MFRIWFRIMTAAWFLGFSGQGIPALFILPELPTAKAASEASEPDEPPQTFGYAPVLTPFYTPETGWGGAGSLILYWNADRSAARPDSGSIFAVHTEKEQTLFGLSIDQYLSGDRFLLKTGLGYSDWHKWFFGIGGHPPEGQMSGFEEQYFTKSFRSEIGLSRKLTEGLYAGVQWFYGDTGIDLADDADWLADSSLPGIEGGRISGPGATITWDTRDEAFFPSRGVLIQAEYNRFETETGSDYAFESASVDARTYLPMRYGHVLAVQGEYTWTDGNVPFYRYPSLAGEGSMRGIEGDRFIDRIKVAIQAEYRFPIFRRFGGVVFAGTGQTAPEHSELLENMKTAAGIGIRYTVEKNKKINLRLDIGFDQDGEKQIYFTLREAF